MKILILAHGRSGSTTLSKALADVLDLDLIIEPFNKRLWEKYFKKKPTYVDGPIPENTIIKHIALPNSLMHFQNRLKEFDKVIFLIRDNVRDAIISKVNADKYGYNHKYTNTEGHKITMADIEDAIKVYRELANNVRFNFLNGHLIWHNDLYKDYDKSMQTIKNLELNIDESQFNKMWDLYLNPSHRLQLKKSNIRTIYSSDNNKVDKDGGPYYYDMNELEKK